jgi:NDP-sugar pyrophosphorylase family protein
MQCVVLAGGLATRLSPRTAEVPKALLPVRGEPFAHHQLNLLAAQGFDDVVYCIGHLGSQIRRYIEDGSRWGLTVRYSDEGETLRGTGGALRLALEASLLDQRFVIVYGDSYLPIDVTSIWDAAIADARPALMTVYADPGSMEVPNAEFTAGTVTLYRKGRPEPTMRYVDYGLSVLQRSVIDAQIPDATVFDLAEMFHALSVQGLLAGYEVAQRFYEIGSAGGLGELEAYLDGSVPTLRLPRKN